MPVLFQPKGGLELKPFAFALILTFVTGCLPEKETDECGAAALQDLVGQDSSVLESMAFPERTRVLEHNQPMTMDHSLTRLNIQSDADGVIARVWCG